MEDVSSRLRLADGLEDLSYLAFHELPYPPASSAPRALRCCGPAKAHDDSSNTPRPAGCFGNLLSCEVTIPQRVDMRLVLKLSSQFSLCQDVPPHGTFEFVLCRPGFEIGL